MRKRAVKKTVSLQPDVWEYVASQAKAMPALSSMRRCAIIADDSYTNR